MDVEWYELRARIPLTIKQSKETGLWFIESPLLRGLLVTGQSRKEAFTRITSCVEDLASAAASGELKE